MICVEFLDSTLLFVTKTSMHGAGHVLDVLQQDPTLVCEAVYKLCPCPLSGAVCSQMCMALTAGLQSLSETATSCPVSDTSACGFSGCTMHIWTVVRTSARTCTIMSVSYTHLTLPTICSV